MPDWRSYFPIIRDRARPPEFNSLFLFVTSRCNSLCRTCFYFDKLNSRDDLTVSQIERLSATAGNFRKLWISGGEPFLRPELGEILTMFVRDNGVRNINLPESVKQTIESKINAEQESQKMKFVLEKEKQEAERKRVEAQGIADYQRILTSTLTDKLLQYEQIKVQKELATSPNAKVVIMGNGKTAPILIGQ